jgi:Domain of unknown function (DUF4375)
MNLNELLERTQKYEQAETPIAEVPEPERTIISVLAAFYPILNGGFRFLFEMDMVCGVRADMLAAAYKRVGLTEHSGGISRVVSVFSDSIPHKNPDEREAFLSKYFEIEDEDGNTNEYYLDFIDEIECSFYGEGKEKIELAVCDYYEQNM